MIKLTRLADYGIVLLENMTRHWATGADLKGAVRLAAGEVSGALVASLLALMAAVTPFLFLGGTALLFFKEFILTIVFATIAGLLAAFAVIPALWPKVAHFVSNDKIQEGRFLRWLTLRYQRLLDGLEARHSTKKLPFLDQSHSAMHPVVLRDPVTQRKMLYVNSNYTECIVGMKEHESESLLRMLYEHVNTPEFHVRLRWRVGTVAVWDERATQHRGVADFVGTRKLRRLTFPGGRPTA